MRKSKWTKELLARFFPQRTAREIPDFFADGRINGMIAQKKDGRICQSAWTDSDDFIQQIRINIFICNGKL